MDTIHNIISKTKTGFANTFRIRQYLKLCLSIFDRQKIAKRRENEKGKFVSISEKIKNIIGVLFTPYVSSTINIFFSIKRKEPVEHLGDGNAQCCNSSYL